ncbi:LysM peptidoglycan-binding domain-containing protein, partial [Paenarthrobacter sp. Z7-10]|uniref:LysM peptidoglycan-binding domain-containing protein n=1 Tax=Paenarthrobacter sp. Z7-10 TaxID=2787635 RepID=UPI0022A98E4F
MSRNSHTPRHRATPVQTGPLTKISTVVASNAGRIGRPVAALAAVSALMLGVGAPAQASATANGPAPASAAGSVRPAAGSSYTIQSGDTLGSIAASHGVSLNDLFALNSLGMNSTIYPGQSIRISGAAGASVPTAFAAPAVYAAPAAAV